MVERYFPSLFFAPIVDLIRRVLGGNKKGTRTFTANRLLKFSACLLLSIWCLRFCVGYYESVALADAPMHWWNIIIDSLIHALQTFSLDESYTEFITNGKTMITDITGREEGFLLTFYETFTSVLNVLAPVITGSVLFEVLVNFFPKIRLFFSGWNRQRPRYYFSKLSDGALALAKSISEDKSITRPLIVFADVDEATEDQHTAAMELGAICLKTDLTKISMPKGGALVIYLISEDELTNVRQLTDL